MDLQTQVEKKLCEDEHLYFTRRFFKPRMGFKFMVNWHHEYVAWLLIRSYSKRFQTWLLMSLRVQVKLNSQQTYWLVG